MATRKLLRSPKVNARRRVEAKRTPTQSRAQQTVDAILGAAKVLLLRDGFDRITTNGIAKTAGVSIGSLYQYFDGRDAIIAELSRRHVDEALSLLHAEVGALLGESLDTGARRLIRVMVEIHRNDPEFHRIIESTRPALGARAQLARVNDRVTALAVAYLERHRQALIVEDLARAAFVVIGTIEALTHNAVLNQPQWLSGEVLIDDITRLVLGYLTGDCSRGSTLDRRTA